MKQELFSSSEPFVKLVKDILETNPKIENSDIPYSLNQLGKNLLSKNWKVRLDICSSEKIIQAINEAENNENLDEFQQQLNNLKSKRSAYNDLSNEINKIKATEEQKRIRRSEILGQLYSLISACFDDLRKEGAYRNHQKSGFFLLDGDISNKDRLKQNFLFAIPKDLHQGFARNVFLFFTTENDENYFCSIQCTVILNSSPITSNDFATYARNIIGTILKDFEKQNKGLKKDTPSNELFKGIISFDEYSKKTIKYKILTLINKAVNKMETEVISEFNRDKQRIQNNARMSFSMLESKIDFITIEE